jgi:HlyD family secretion protein
MDTALFRKVSLDRLSSPEQIDHLLEVTTARGWIALLALCITLTAGIVWSVTGSSDTTVKGRGVLARTGGVNVVVAMGSGSVTEINVHVGEMVKAGQVVARIAQPALEEKLKHSRSEIQEAEQARTRVLSARDEGDAAKLIAYKKQIASNEKQISDTLEQIKFAKEQIPVDDQLVAKGLITKQTALSNRQKVAALESDVQKLGAQISQLESEQVSMRNDTAQTALDYTNKINGMTRELRMNEEDLRRASSVTTPYDGRVVEIASYEGALVGSGQPLLSLEVAAANEDLTTGRGLGAYIYVPAGEAKQVEPGMEAHISPSGVQQEEYGYMLGNVDYVAKFPATLEAITRTFENDALARTMMGDSAVTEAHVTLQQDPNTRTGYAWSSRKGPPNAVSGGSVATVEVVTRKQHPIELVLPYIKKKLGL